VGSVEKDYFSSPLTEAEVRAMGSLALAHVGDAVFELLVRVHLASSGGKNGSLHRAAVEMVNASAQAGDMEKLLPFLTGEEAEVFRRGRNVKVHSVPKHARLGDYHAATGLEALFGYLYLLGRRERICALFAAIVEES
jgi:ribonuclease-3 family protein